MSDIVIDNPWRRLRQFTDARIGLGRSGVSIPTARLLEFQLAHAQAQDAVHTPLDTAQLCQDLRSLSLGEPLCLKTEAIDRGVYLQRPDLGRRLDEASRNKISRSGANRTIDLALVLVDGLSSKAIQQNAAPFLQALISERENGQREHSEQSWNLSAPVVVEQGRVAIGDEIGELMKADAVLVLVGERPGLSSPDSLGLYLTWAPRVGRTDAERNCISNIRPQGQPFEQAAHRLLYLLRTARAQKLSGVALKDRSDEQAVEHHAGAKNFLLIDN